ncbi:MAG: hypothetical protein ACOYD3_05070 [Kiritimatiellia bacterium]|jgi:hypothetical protein
MQNKSIKLLCTAILCILTAAVQAVEYDLWVNNERFTSDKLTIQCGPGTAVFNGTSTLTLNSALITNSCTIDGLGAGIVSRLPALTITINNSVKIDNVVQPSIITNVWGAGITTADAPGGSGSEPLRDIVFAGGGPLRIHTTNAVTGYGVYYTGDSWNRSGTKIHIHSATTGIWAGWRFGHRSSNLGFTIITDSGPGIFTTNSFDYASGHGSYLNIDAAGDGIVCGTYSHSDYSPLSIKAGGYGIRRTLPGGLTISDRDQSYYLNIESGMSCFDVDGSISITRHTTLRSGDKALATTNGAITLGARNFDIASTNTAIQAGTTISATSARINIDSGGTAFQAATGITLEGCTITTKVTQASAALAELTSGNFKITRCSLDGTSAGRGFVLGGTAGGTPYPAHFYNLSGHVAMTTGGDGIDGTTGSTARFSGGSFRVTGAAGTKSIDLADGDAALELHNVVIADGGVSQPNIVIASQFSHIWIATAPGALWSDASSWSGGDVPYNTDIVRFEAPYLLAAGTVPPDFAGTFNVAPGIALTNEIPDDGESRLFSTAVEEGGIFVKTGAGACSVKPQAGYYPGAIEIAAGTVTFRGNGWHMAPGMFGDLTVAPGATAVVADSPFDRRHGALTKSTPKNSAPNDPSYQYTTADDVRGMWDAWAGIVGASTNTCRKFYTPCYTYGMAFRYGSISYDTSAAYLSGSVFFAYGSDDYENFGRAIWLCSYDEPRYMSTSFDNGGRIFIDDINCSASATRTFAKGWHNIDWSHWDRGGGESIYLRFGSKQTLPGEVITADFLWNGVCFGRLDLAAGATLDIGSGQAVGFASAGTHNVAGSVTGAADSCLTIALAGTPFVLDDVADFPGLVEVGYPAKAKATTDQSTASYTIIGHGEVIASTGVDARIGTAFEGTINVGEGATFTQSATHNPKITYAGSGTVVSSAGATVPTKGYAGSIVVSDGTTVAADGGALSGWKSVTLTDGGTLDIPASTLARSGKEELLQDWTTGTWSLNGTTRDSGYEAGAAYVDNEGALVLTDDGGRQRRTAFITNTVFRLADIWKVSFTYHASLPGKHEKERPGEGLAVILQANSATACDTDAAARYAMRATDKTALHTANGFAFKQNESSDTGFDWVGMGGVGSDLGDTPDASGFDLLQPIAVTVSYADKRLAIVFEQGTLKSAKELDIASIGEFYGRFWFGFAAGTGATDADGTVVGLKQRITNFSGWIHRESFAETPLEGFTVSPGNWHLNGNARFEYGDSEIVVMRDSGDNGSAVCHTPIRMDTPYRINYRQVIEGTPTTISDPRVNTFGSFMVQGYGTNYYRAGTGSFGYPSGSPAAFALMTNTDEHQNGSYYCWSWTEGNAEVECLNYLNTMCYPDRNTYTNDVALYYDGNSSVRMEVRRPTTSGTAFRQLKNLSYFQTNGWLSVIGSGPRGYRPERFLNVEVYEGVNADLPVRVPVNVAANASAALSVGSVTTNATAPVATVEELALGAGSALSLTNLTGGATIAGIGNLAIGGAGESITTATNVVLALDTLDFTQVAHPGTGNPFLAITGNWTMRGDVVTIRIPRAWQEHGTVDVVSFANATYVGSGEPAFRVVFVNDDNSEQVTQLDAWIGTNTRFLRINPRFGMMILLR